MSQPYYETSRDTERAFYAAFQRANLREMMRVWAEEDGIVCIHPMGPRLDGRTAVSRSWEQIFASGASMRFALSEVSCMVNGDLAVHCVHENIDHGRDFGQRSVVLATNVYRSTERGWRMLVHHASPAGEPLPREASPASTLH